MQGTRPQWDFATLLCWLELGRPAKFVSVGNPRILPVNASTLASGQIALCGAIVCFGFAYQQRNKKKEIEITDYCTVRETSLQNSRNEATFENANRQQPIQLEAMAPVTHIVLFQFKADVSAATRQEVCTV